MLTRRKLLGGAAGLGGASLAGCVTSLTGGGGSDLTVWSITTLQPDNWDRLTEDSNVSSVKFVSAPTNVGTVTSKILQGSAVDQYEVMGQLSTMEDNFAEKLRTVDSNKIDNWGAIPSAFKEYPNTDNNPIKTGDGRTVGVPMVGNGDAFVYREEKTGKLDSYGALFDEEFKGKVALEDNWATSGAKTALYLKANNMADIDNPANMDEEEIKTVVDFLIEKKKAGQFRTLWSGYGEAVSLVTSGEVWLEDAWYPMMLDMRDKGIDDAQYASPKEGYHKWSINMYMLDGKAIEGKESAVYDLFNWQLGGWYGAHITNNTGYMVASDNALEYAKNNGDEVDTDFVEKQFDRVSEALNGPGYWTNRTPDNKGVYEEEWQRFKNA